MNFEMHLCLWKVSHLEQAELLNCNEILGRVADYNYIQQLLIRSVKNNYQGISGIPSRNGVTYLECPLQPSKRQFTFT